MLSFLRYLLAAPEPTPHPPNQPLDTQALTSFLFANGKSDLEIDGRSHPYRLTCTTYHQDVTITFEVVHEKEASFGDVTFSQKLQGTRISCKDILENRETQFGRECFERDRLERAGEKSLRGIGWVEGQDIPGNFLQVIAEGEVKNVGCVSCGTEWVFGLVQCRKEDGSMAVSVWDYCEATHYPVCSKYGCTECEESEKAKLI